jgi:hypothetical protein
MPPYKSIPYKIAWNVYQKTYNTNIFKYVKLLLKQSTQEIFLNSTGQPDQNSAYEQSIWYSSSISFNLSALALFSVLLVAKHTEAENTVRLVHM